MSSIPGIQVGIVSHSPLAKCAVGMHMQSLKLLKRINLSK